MDPETPPRDEPGDAPWRFAGHWFIGLGVVTFLSMPLSWILNGRVLIDFSGLLMMGLGSSLLRRGRWAWRVGVGACVGGLILSLGVVVAALLGRAEGVTTLGAKNPAPDLALVSFGTFVLSLLPPLVALLRPDARNLAGKAPGPRPPGRTALVYIFLLAALPPGAYSFSRQVKKESTSIGTTLLPRARGNTWIYSLYCSDGGSPARTAITRWIVELPPSSDPRPRNGQEISVNGRKFRMATPLSWILIRPDRSKGANIVLVTPEGREIAVHRRVTIANAAAVEAAARGFTDAEDLERRLLNAIPP